MQSTSRSGRGSPEGRIEAFLASPSFAVVGASDDMQKYGAKVLACYRQNGRRAFAVNPHRDTVQGQTSYENLRGLPERVEAVSIVTPPKITERIIEDALEAGVRHVWLQPGAESEAAVAMAESAGLSVISGGPCLLVRLGYRGP